jgi:hypothetical protein
LPSPHQHPPDLFTHTSDFHAREYSREHPPSYPQLTMTVRFILHFNVAASNTGLPCDHLKVIGILKSPNMGMSIFRTKDNLCIPGAEKCATQKKWEEETAPLQNQSGLPPCRIKSNSCTQSAHLLVPTCSPAPLPTVLLP